MNVFHKTEGSTEGLIKAEACSKAPGAVRPGNNANTFALRSDQCNKYYGFANTGHFKTWKLT